MESSSSSSTDKTDPRYKDSLKVQIVAYDSYQTKPSVLDRCYSSLGLPHNEEIIASGRPFTEVPIVRIYGKLQTGHTVVLNVHNCFPYIFIEYDGNISGNRDVTIDNLKKLKLEIEKQLYLSFMRVKLRNDDSNEQIGDQIKTANAKDDNDPSNYENKYISSLQLVKSVPFYGYHIGFTAFVKISLINPRYISRLSEILLLGKVKGKVFQPYESHIPFLLQFLADFNLYGCDWMYLKNHLWRSPIVCNSLLGQFVEPEFEYLDEEIEMFNEMKINQNLKDFLYMNITPFKEESMLGEVTRGINVTSEEQFPRTSSTLLELDCIPQWILNITSLQTRDLHHDFIELLNKNMSSVSKKYLSSTEDILKDVLHQRMIRGLNYTDFFAKLSLMNDNDVRKDNEDWVEQEELHELLRHCIDLSKDEYRKQTSPEFPSFVNNPPHFQFIQTPKESIMNGMFKNIQWHKLELVEKLDMSFDQSSFITTSTPVDMRVLPSSMFEDNIDILPESDRESNLEDDIPDENWLGTVPPHKSTESDVEDSILQDSELDRIEADLLAKPIQGEKPPDRTVSFSIETSNFNDLDHSKLTVSQNSNHRRSSILPRLNPVLRSTKTSASGSTYEFIGTAGLPQSNQDFLNSFSECGLLENEYKDPFYSNPEDVPSLPFIFAGTKFVLHSNNYSTLPKVSVNGQFPSSECLAKCAPTPKERTFEFRLPMPSVSEVQSWVSTRPIVSKSQILKSQIAQSTPNLKFGFKFPSVQNNYKKKKSRLSKLITLAVEIHVNCRGDLKPDPKEDEILAIFWSFDKENYPFDLDIAETGVLILCTDEEDDPLSKYQNTTSTPIAVFDNEISMIKELISIVKLVDPDVLTGFEIHGKSWGYIIERFRLFYDIDLCSKLSRVTFKGNNKFGDRWGYTHASAIRISGRHMLNLWRILRNDMNLLRYTVENVTFHLLHRRIPHYAESQLTEWFQSGKPSDISAVLNYYVSRTKLLLEILDRQDIVSKTTEQARLIGVDFYSIFYRGSQYRVESFLIRLTKSENFMLISPSKQQVFKADALQCIPLVMEPTSAFYKSPLVVLDFQSLYPSIVIAYNYCYSTLLGRLRGYNAKYPQTIGIAKNKLKPGLLDLLKDHITISPNGLMFVKSEVRKSTLAKMLTEILETRILVKKTMSDVDDDYELSKLYDSRQLALKLLANVTYGYTSASFSGRMPCADLADAIVSTGRETLNRSIKQIESNERWGAKVVYGDTDSLFVYFPGKSRADAFKFGKEAAEYITSINPKPMVLKFEKVYHPCVLLSKKRYVGYSYSHENQVTPKFDAKGIETVRRDGIPAQQKIVEKSLRILFETCDLSQVKEYVQDQFSKIMNNKVSVQDFCFAKEVRMGTYKDERYAPAGAHVSKKLMEADKRAEPQYRERVPYVVLRSYKGDRLRDRCVTPQFFLDNEVKDGLQLDAEYYITKTLIPPLERIFNLMGVDIKEWYRDMPRKLKYALNYEDLNLNKKRKLNNLNLYILSSNCICCSGRTRSHKNLCGDCLKNELSTIVKLTFRVKSAEEDFKKIMMMCRTCSSNGYKNYISNTVETAENCISEDCPVFYSRLKARRKLDSVALKESAVIEELNSW